MEEKLNEYAITLLEDTQILMDEYQDPELAFTASVLDKIGDLIDCTEPVLSHCRILSMDNKTLGEIHGYAENSNKEMLYLFYTDYNPSQEIKSKSNTDCQEGINRAQGFFKRASQAVYVDKDMESDEYKTLKYVYDNIHHYQAVTILLISNCILNNVSIKKIKTSRPLYLDVWDLRKIYGNTHSLSDHAAINLDFESDEYKNFHLPFLQMESHYCPVKI